MNATKSKNVYQRMIKEYESRRIKLRKQCPTWKIDNPEYVQRSRTLTKKISTWKRAVRRIEERDKKIAAIAGEICDFMDIARQGWSSIYPLTKSINSGDKKIILARFILYKYAIEEQGITASFISHYIGGSWRGTASVGRRKFTRSFPFNQQNRDTYHNFKQYVKNNYCVGDKIAVAA